ncbi:MAG: hypothetical protein AAB267_03525 [Candidatus Desantisbacteria bacterium]
MKGIKKLLFLGIVGIIGMIGIVSLVPYVRAAYEDQLPIVDIELDVPPIELGSATIMPATSTVRQNETATLTFYLYDVNGRTITTWWNDHCNRNPQFQWSGSGTFASANSRTTTYTPPTIPGTYIVCGTITEGPNSWPNDPEHPDNVLSTQTFTAITTATITVIQQAVNTIEIASVTTTPVVGKTGTFMVIAKDALNGVISGVKGTWSCGNGDGTMSDVYATSTVLNTGTGAKTGTVGVTVVDGTNTFVLSIPITLLPDIPAIITVSPGTKDLTIGQTQQFTANVTDKWGNQLSNIVNWALTDNAIGTLSATTGASTIFVGTTAGTTVLIASTATTQGTANITVQGIKFILPQQTAGIPIPVELIGLNGYNGIATLSVTAGTYTINGATFTSTAPGTITIAAGTWTGNVTSYLSCYQTVTIVHTGGTIISNLLYVDGGKAVRAKLDGVNGVIFFPGRVPSTITVTTLDQWDNPATPKHPSYFKFTIRYFENGGWNYPDQSILEYDGSPNYYPLSGQKITTFAPGKFPYLYSHDSARKTPTLLTAQVKVELNVVFYQSN